MSFQVNNPQQSFESQLKKIKEISNTEHLYLNTKLEGSLKQDSTLVSWLKWVVSLIPTIHIAQTSPARVAQSVAKFAEEHQKYLQTKDQVALIDVIEKLKAKCQTLVKGKEQALDRIIDKIKSLKLFPEMDALPLELLDLILSKLAWIDYESCSEVNWRWNEATVEVAKRRATLAIRAFIQSAITYCNRQILPPLVDEENNTPAPDPDDNFWQKVVKDLVNIKDHLDFSKATTFSQLRDLIFCEKIKFLGVIHLRGYEPSSRLERELAPHAKNLEFPWIFNEVFKVSRDLEDCILKGARLVMSKGLFDKTLEIASFLSDEKIKDALLFNLSVELKSSGQRLKAFKVAKSISNLEQYHKCRRILLITPAKPSKLRNSIGEFFREKIALLKEIVGALRRHLTQSI
ncbi:hypothetical protein [Parachlamydia sp. AcF125]|uniref:hypothetical protein n=1 Tax=Parachlamydia sp. AcF125 TaxID=2795736 RepID=UPI001BCA6633|nr:hypothetical protein [Parachlamydia sp. AcF125]MBS4168487.1 hypothetical protein [Parachlamydia sp. AcF125]